MYLGGAHLRQNILDAGRKNPASFMESVSLPTGEICTSVRTPDRHQPRAIGYYWIGTDCIVWREGKPLPKNATRSVRFDRGRR